MGANIRINYERGKMSRVPVTAKPPEPEITGLVRKAIEGNVEAYGEVYKLCLDRIYRYVFYQVKDTMTAEDITEEVFIKAWKAIRTCRGQEDTFLPWLYRIAHNQMIDTLKKEIKVLQSTDTNAFIDNFEERVEQSLKWQQVLDNISTLPEQQRQVVILKFIEGVDNIEISLIMGKRQGAIRILQMRALTALRRQLSKEASGNGD